MFGSGFDDEDWKDGFSDFMRSARMVKEETIEAYIDYIEKVAAKLGKRSEDLAGSSERLNEALKSLDAVPDWGSKTKGNYKTALNRLNAYLMSRSNATGNNIPSCGRLASKDRELQVRQIPTAKAE